VPEVIYYVASSLDGYIATPDGGVEWLSQFESGHEDYGYSAFYESVDACLLGSRTYEQTLAFGQPPCPAKRCWVFSGRDLPQQEGVIVSAREPREVVAEMDGLGVKRAWLIGGGELAASLRADGLITSYIVSIMPVILGQGIPLFARRGQQETLGLDSVRTYVDGVIQATYRPASNEEPARRAPEAG
jgi:dihydrofolate reductase